MQRYLNFLLLLFVAVSCSGNHVTEFAEFVEIGAIQKVKISNNSGTFQLDDNQLELFRHELEKLTYAPGMSAKVGAIRIVITVDGEDYDLITSTHGDYVEVPVGIITRNKDCLVGKGSCFFRMNGVNFDNFKP